VSAADRFSLRRPSRLLAAILVVAVGVWAGPAGAGTAKDKDPPGSGAPASPGNGNGNANGHDKDKDKGKDKPKDDGASSNGNGNGDATAGATPDAPGADASEPLAADESDAPVDEQADSADDGGEPSSPEDDPAVATLGPAEGVDPKPASDESGAPSENDLSTQSTPTGGDAPASAPKSPKPANDTKPSLPAPPPPSSSQAPISIAPSWTQPFAAPPAKPKPKRTHEQNVLGRWHSSSSNARVVRGVNGAAGVEVTTGNAHGRFTLVTAKPLVADRIPYRVNAWLRTDTPGLTVCLRFVEKEPGWKGKRVRSSETCVAPTTEWKRFRVDALSVARGNVLRVAAVVYGSFGDASFELSRLKVEKKVSGRWTKIRGAKLTPSA
jgi:hypothetical protein